MKDRVSLSRTDFSLVIKNLKAEDFTVFRCVLAEYPKKEETEYRLHPITVSVSPAIVLASQPLSLDCNVEKSTVSTEIKWSAPQNPGFSSQDSTLRVTDVSGRDHGVWTCTVTYGGRTAVATTSVTVVDLSPNPPQPIYHTLGSSTSSLLLPCSLANKLDSSYLSGVGFKGGHWSFTPFPWDVTPEDSRGPQKFLLSPDPQPQWKTPQGLRVNGTALETERHNLSMVQKIEEGGGFYTCALDFKDGVQLSRTVRVEVLRIVSSQGNPALVGQELNLTCTLGHSSLNNLTLKWTAPRLSSISPLPSAPHQPLLSIPTVRENDKGMWHCQLLEEGKVLATATLSLRTERVPVDVWLVVSICGAAVALVLLLPLISICVRRHRQKMFIRRRRKPKYCRCKHPQVKGFYKS
ncbi:hypothetical protein SKAU_G00225030 [Synaphobranchus kaupii]|uniref:Ig-like domain-containing protein n=1 Tax=Synaphobranchus kaupii TaxID=118154 RepID=A0A9Q1FC01_SYNKA|nr:hypothetical protein SKAU_G00225030 [Synaphobranchus kaupii]